MTSPTTEALRLIEAATGRWVSTPASEREITELETVSALIAQMKAQHKAELCENGMPGRPPCRTLAEAIRDVRRRAEEC